MGAFDRDFFFVVETEIVFRYWINLGQSKLKVTNIIHQSTSVKKSNTVDLRYELILRE